MERGRLGTIGALVAKRVEEELDQEEEAATLHHHRNPVEIVLVLQPKQVNVTQILVVLIHIQEIINARAPSHVQS